MMSSFFGSLRAPPILEKKPLEKLLEPGIIYLPIAWYLFRGVIQFTHGKSLMDVNSAPHKGNLTRCARQSGVRSTFVLVKDFPCRPVNANVL